MREPVALLTGEQASPLLQAALTGRPGGTVPGFRCTVDQVHDRIGAETSVTYHVSYDSSDYSSHDSGGGTGEGGGNRPGDRPGAQRVSDYLVATTADVKADVRAGVEADSETGATATVHASGLTVHVWRHPADPRLPGLAGACTPEVLAAWLPERRDTGPGAERDQPDDLGTAGVDATTVLVYRPLRRAVLRTERGREVYFTKVVRPGPGELLVRRHTLLAGLGPDVVAAPAPGVLVTWQVPGSSLAVALSAWQLGESPVRPDPAAALALLDRLPQEALDLPARPSWTDRVDFHRAMAAAALPEHAAEIDLLGGQIAELAAAFPVGPLVPTHGDFHEGNIFCTDGRPARMIDVYTVGPGRREDDLACLVAHLAVLPGLSPGHYPRGAELTDSWARAFEQHVHPGALRARVAGVLLSLVSATERAQALSRLDLARAWVWRARALA